MIDYFAMMAVLFAIYAIIALLYASAGTILAITLGAILTIVFLTASVRILVTSPGKCALGLHVLRPDGSRVGPRRKFCRWVLSELVFHIGCLMIAFRKDERGLHDLICDTVVVRL